MIALAIPAAAEFEIADAGELSDQAIAALAALLLDAAEQEAVAQ